ncbi:hypothetical protein PIB30_013846 [Stylosanthes scabra]|uniref:Uncharacterized protein n=1 Tax=Stylosanthes scabra TaxID=79078 RepID=A0ABU6T6A7_9FABA|nr:hypothetical protein [Stylosanthes scabra]
MVQEKTMRAGLVRTAKAPLTNKGKHKKNTRNGSSSESEYISSDSVYEEGYDSDSEMTRSEAIVRVERKSKRKNDSVPAPVHDPDFEPIPATQDVIEINSDDEDPEPRPIKMLIPKVETSVASSPASMLITDVLMSMADDAAPEPHHEEESQPDPSMSSFSLNFDNPTPPADEQTPPPPQKHWKWKRSFH